MASPNQVADYLRKVATGIDNSKNPSKELVARDLRKILAIIDTGNKKNEEEKEKEDEEET